MRFNSGLQLDGLKPIFFWLGHDAAEAATHNLALFKWALTDLCRVVVRALGPKDTGHNKSDCITIQAMI